MNDEEALKAGWKSGDAADFLGMTEAERQELDVCFVDSGCEDAGLLEGSGQVR